VPPESARVEPALRVASGCGKTIFRAAGRPFTVRDAIRAAEARGRLTSVRERVRANLACERYAHEEGFVLDEAVVETAAEEYRLANELTTAFETERWLAEHVLTLEDFAGWLARLHWSRRFGPAGLAAAPVVPAGDVDRLVWPELVFGRLLEPLSRELAVLVAARLASGTVEPASDWSRGVDGMVAALETLRCAFVTPPLVEREFGARTASLVRFELQVARFHSMDVAREAWLCVTEDGEPLVDVSRRSGGRFEDVRTFLDGLPAGLQARVLSARPGEVVAPLVVEGDAVMVCRVLTKQLPTLDEPAVRERVESALVARGEDWLVGEHIRWV
jgi:hypothetical protein